MDVVLLDYGAGNVRSVRNAIKKLGYTVTDAESPQDILTADKLIFPGVGSFGMVMKSLHKRGFVQPLKERISEDRPFLGICVALQTLFAGSEESPGIDGLGVLKGKVKRFTDKNFAVPQIGWNNIDLQKDSNLFTDYRNEKLYFVHSYFAPVYEENMDWLLSLTDYGTEFVSAVQHGKVSAFQFHPEKSGRVGLGILEKFLKTDTKNIGEIRSKNIDACKTKRDKTVLAKRIIACLDVRSNDNGDLVVTKGDQYDVRDKGRVRNLGKPVELAKRYYEEGADEITFLNITGFRDFPMQDQPMLEVLQKSSENVFVPITIGGGIREFTDSNGVTYSALNVASAYFRAGADKISIGSDAVYAVEEYLRSGKKSGMSSIEQISRVYGAQAVVVSVDPRRVVVQSPDDTDHATIRISCGGDKGKHCWYQCTVQGGRKCRDIDVVQLVSGCEELGAGEILLNCIDRDGTNSGFDLDLIRQVKNSVSIPVIASSGAGNASHFVEVFAKTDTDAALAAGIFHRREVAIAEVKKAVRDSGTAIR